MKTKILILLAILSVSCTGSAEKYHKRALDIAEDYIRGQLGADPEESSSEGIISIKDQDKEFIIDPVQVFTGMIDEDNEVDAIVSLATFNGSYQGTTEHLIMISTDGGFSVQKVIESDMRILQLKDRVITAEVPQHPRDSPLFNCPECRDIIRYKYSMGDLVKAE